MIGLLWKVVGPWLGRNGLLAASIAGVLALVMAWDGSRIEAAKTAERNEVVSEIAREGAEANAKGLEAHLNARRPGAFKRLRERYCLDCEGKRDPEMP